MATTTKKTAASAATSVTTHPKATPKIITSASHKTGWRETVEIRAKAPASTSPKTENIIEAQIRREIERRAYQYFVDRGYAHGHDREDWTMAEQEVRRLIQKSVN